MAESEVEAMVSCIMTFQKNHDASSHLWTPNSKLPPISDSSEECLVSHILGQQRRFASWSSLFREWQDFQVSVVDAATANHYSQSEPLSHVTIDSEWSRSRESPMQIWDRNMLILGSIMSLFLVHLSHHSLFLARDVVETAIPTSIPL